jgi:DNA repair protein RadA/Sms
MQVMQNYGMEIVPVSKVLDAIVAALPRNKFEVSPSSDESKND